MDSHTFPHAALGDIIEVGPFPYTVVDIFYDDEDGATSIDLEGGTGGFDMLYLEIAQVLNWDTSI